MDEFSIGSRVEVTRGGHQTDQGVVKRIGNNNQPMAVVVNLDNGRLFYGSARCLKRVQEGPNAR